MICAIALVTLNFVLKRWANVGFWDSYHDSTVFLKWICHILHGLTISIALLVIF
ncbi:hypothetical protein ALT785_530017 [Alteromonas infernus]